MRRIIAFAVASLVQSTVPAAATPPDLLVDETFDGNVFNAFDQGA